MNIKLLTQIVIGVAGYVTWAIMAYVDPAQRPDFLKFNIVMAMGTIGVVLRDMRSPDAPPATPPADKQSGRAAPLLLATLGIVSLLFLTGCAGLNVSWEVVATYNTPHATPGAPISVPESTK